MSANPHARAAASTLKVLEEGAKGILTAAEELQKNHSTDTNAPIDVDRMLQALQLLENELGGYRGALFALRSALARSQAEIDRRGDKRKGGKR